MFFFWGGGGGGGAFYSFVIQIGLLRNDTKRGVELGSL